MPFFLIGIVKIIYFCCCSLDGKKKGDEVAAISSFKENASEQKDDADHLTILSILLHNPEEMYLKRKLSAIRENDNDAYVSKRSVKQYYTYNASGSSTAHRGENSTWYVKVKDGKAYKRQYVNQNEA